MICEFCGADNAAGHPVATRLGRAAILCKQCQTEHGVYAKRQGAKRPTKPKKRRKSKDLPGQLLFPFMKTETDGLTGPSVSQLHQPFEVLE